MPRPTLDGNKPAAGDQFLQRHFDRVLMGIDPVRAKPPLCDALGRISGVGMR